MATNGLGEGYQINSLQGSQIYTRVTFVFGGYLKLLVYVVSAETCGQLWVRIVDGAHDIPNNSFMFNVAVLTLSSIFYKTLR